MNIAELFRRRHWDSSSSWHPHQVKWPQVGDWVGSLWSPLGYWGELPGVAQREAAKHPPTTTPPYLLRCWNLTPSCSGSDRFVLNLPQHGSVSLPAPAQTHQTPQTPAQTHRPPTMVREEQRANSVVAAVCCRWVEKWLAGAVVDATCQDPSGRQVTSLLNNKTTWLSGSSYHQVLVLPSMLDGQTTTILTVSVW